MVRNVKLEVFQNNRLLRYQITSSIQPSKKKFQAPLSKDPSYVITFVSLQKENVGDIYCTNPKCDEVVLIDNTGLFECTTCDTIAKIEVPTPKYNVTVKLEDNSQKTLTMSEKVFKTTNVASKKELFSCAWEISIDDEMVTKIVKKE